MIVDISNEVLTMLKSTLTGVTVLEAFPSTTPDFPCVVVQEIINISDTETIDSDGEKYGSVSIQIDIFSDADNKVTVVKGIRNSIDGIMAGTYRMTRNTSTPTPNFLDKDIYRYTLIYGFKINSTQKIYRG